MFSDVALMRCLNSFVTHLGAIQPVGLILRYYYV